MRVLVTGGSGYLGQFLLASLAPHHTVGYTFLSQPLPAAQADDPTRGTLRAFKADLATGEGLQEAVLDFQPHVVLNCAAMSQPAACERDYAACRAINRPGKLAEALQQLQERHGLAALLIHLSTDQVYDGSRAWWSEVDPPGPVNAYGRSKLEAEQLLAEAWPGRHLVLRSSLIYGPEPPLAPVQRPLFVQFMQRVLSDGTPTTFFVDEFRCAVYVFDICAIVSHVISRCTEAQQCADQPHHHHHHQQQQQQQQQQGGAASAAQPAGCTLAQLPHTVYNMGGPERLSRHDMALALAQHCKLGTAAVLTAKSADVQRGYESPPDISMKVDRLLQDMPAISLTPFAAALQHIFPRTE